MLNTIEEIDSSITPYILLKDNLEKYSNLEASTDLYPTLRWVSI